MNIVMWCGGIPFDGDTIKHRSLGGSESAAYYMAEELSRLGYKVTLFTHTKEPSVSDGGVKYIPIGTTTDDKPLGDNFHFFAENTPHDVLIIQRHLKAFTHRFASKLNLWWLHDLASHRNTSAVHSMLYNIDGVLVVSEFHKKQVCEVYGIKEDYVHVVHNGIDLSLFENELSKDNDSFYELGCGPKQVKLLYSSRPERGLEHLVGPEGIMERLHNEGTSHHLYVCGYDNETPDTRNYYAALYDRCRQLPNVTLLGALTKQELADVMRQCDMMVYPCPGPAVPHFDEVSCITAMECMAAGLPFISSERGALPETCARSGSILLPPKEDGMPDHDLFIRAIKELTCAPYHKVQDVVYKQLSSAGAFTWAKACEDLHIAIDEAFVQATEGKYIARIKHMMRHSDVMPLTQELFCNLDPELGEPIDIIRDMQDELYECYSPLLDNPEVYYADYYAAEKERGTDHGAEDTTSNSRYIAVLHALRSLPAGNTVLDYGCAHGHYTINLAKQLPDLCFVGVDLVNSNIEAGRAWAETDGLKNVEFHCGSFYDGAVRRASDGSAIPLTDVSALLVTEVLEHAAEPVELIDGLINAVEPGKVLITTPYGPWEGQGFVKYWPWRNHLWHFDREDVVEMFGHHPGFKFNVVPEGSTAWGDPAGSFLYSFDRPVEASRFPVKGVDDIVPSLQTVSVCMIVKDAEDTLMRTLKSIQDVATEVVIRVDPSTTDRTRQVVERFKELRPVGYPTVRCYDGGTPVADIGFDAARNETVEKAQCDWLLWIDSDEVLVDPYAVYKYLRNNCYDGYAVTHNHISAEPAGLLKKDIPVRLFRNGIGIRFFGVVHEHPEKALNEGVGNTLVTSDIVIAHYGYENNRIRQSRFYRNIDLMKRDREQYPERVLGKFLWVRDLSQLCQLMHEQNGGHVTERMEDMAREGIALWEDLVEGGYLRVAIDALEFYSPLVQILGQGFNGGFALDTSKRGDIDLAGIKHVKATFASKEHMQRLFTAVLDERTKLYDSPYA